MQRSAVLLAAITIAMWGFLALLGSKLSHVPPFLLVGIALTAGGLIGLPQARQWKIPLPTLVTGVGGIFGYHFLLFTAFQHAPAVEANLLNYLWPLLIVLLSPAILPGYHLKAYHLVGALLGISGAALIATGGKLSLDLTNLYGYVLATAAAFIWAVYSLLTKRLPPFPTAAVGVFCLISGLLSLAVYALQSSAGVGVRLSLEDWLLITALGAGPMGLAFYTWDAAIKRGDPRIIGSLSYLTPLLSTLLLVLLGGRPFSPVSALAMLFIVGGAVTGSWDLFRRSPAASPVITI